METENVSEGNEVEILRDECNFIQNVSQFFNQEDLSDAKLVIEGKVYNAHKFVLAKSSDVFRTMMYDKRYSHETHHEYELNESAECQHVFEQFLRFLYTAEIGITVETAVGILCLADKYCVASLKTLCVRYMVENSQAPKYENALLWYSWSKALCLADLFDQCSKTISWNSNQLLYVPDWLNMTFDFINDLLNRSGLVVRTEYALYTALVRWVMDDQRTNNLEENASKLFPLIRFPQMYVKELCAIESSDMLERPETSKVLSPLISKAHRFRSLCPSLDELDISFKEQFYLPRNYTDLAVDTVKMQNTLRFGIQVDVKMFVGPVPNYKREGEWKITYRKSNDNWTLQFFCHDSALVQGEARVEVTVLVSDGEDDVIQVIEMPEGSVSRGNHMTVNVNVEQPDDAQTMMVIIKPVPSS